MKIKYATGEQKLMVTLDRCDDDDHHDDNITVNGKQWTSAKICKLEDQIRDGGAKVDGDCGPV